MTDFERYMDALNRHTEREELKLGKIVEHLSVISDTQIQQKVILAEHIRRSTANEAALELMRADVPARLADAVGALSSRIRPLEDGVLTWAAMGKVGAALVTLAGALVGILKLLGKI